MRKAVFPSWHQKPRSSSEFPTLSPSHPTQTHSNPIQPTQSTFTIILNYTIYILKSITTINKMDRKTNREEFRPKPFCPYTSYVLFFQLERNYILQTTDARNAPGANDTTDELVSERPQKYRTIVMLKDWFINKRGKKKQKDHKNHGVILFLDLTKTIANHWKSGDDEIKTFCKKLAKKQLVHYQEEIKASTFKNMDKRRLQPRGRKESSGQQRVPKKIV